jgi:hypothetical protein
MWPVRGVGVRRGVLLAASAATVVLALGAPAPAYPAGSEPVVATVAGSGTPGAPHSGSVATTAALDGPQSIATDAAGDLAIADTDACQVDVVASHHERLFGRTMSPGHLYVVAGGACGSRRGAGVGVPVGVAWGNGRLFELNAANDAVVAVGRSGRVTPVAGTGHSGAPHLAAVARTSPLDHPGGIGTDAAGDLFIADTGDCRVLMVPRASATFFGQAMSSGHVYAVAGTGTCTLANASGPARSAQLSAPSAVTVDQAGDLFITESGRQDVDEVPAVPGTYYGVPIGAGDIAPVAGSGSNNTFLGQGQPATGSYAEMNYPGGTAVDGAGDLFIADGFDHAVMVVPAHGTVLWGRSRSGGNLYVAAGAVPITPSGSAAGDGTQWIGGRLVDPSAVVWAGGRLLVADPGANKVVRVS